MSIFVIGINHKTAPIDVREKVYFAFERLSLYLQDLLSLGYVQEAVLLSTCNRSELYCAADSHTLAYEWFCAQTTASQAELAACVYVYQDAAAVDHMMSVACGLDSMILGEPQILGQMKEAFSESCAASAVDSLFYRLFQQIFAIAKEIRSTTDIGACPVSVASSAVHFVKQKAPSLASAQVVLIGAGETTGLIMRYLQTILQRPVVFVNRSLEKAAALAAEFNAACISLDQLDDVLQTADVVFSATSSLTPIITRESLTPLLTARGQRPLILMDLAVPRDIETDVNDLPCVQLHCIDDLKTIIANNRQGREHAAEKAKELIQERSQTFVQGLESLDQVAHTIRAYRGQIESICQAELIKAKHQLIKGLDPHTVLDGFAHAFINKLMHAPSIQLRQAGAEGRYELLNLAKQLFSLSDLDLDLNRERI